MSVQPGGESFELPVHYKGRESEVPCRLVLMGYTYKIYVQMGEHEIIFEPDEERHFRAVMENAEALSFGPAVMPDWTPENR